VKTFTESREFVTHLQYYQDRKKAIAALDLDSIDEPIVDIVSAFAGLSFCFPLQSCFGHFVCDPEQNTRTLAPVPKTYAGSVRYRIAYIALCIENCRNGRILHNFLAEIPTIDPAYIQFGSADWFWEQFANSYILQIEPVVHKGMDEAILEAAEARHVQIVRDLFFNQLRNLVCKELAERI
jgi:hypothetical protein